MSQPTQQIADRPTVRLCAEEVDPVKPSSPYSDSFPRVVYIPDGGQVLIGTSASEAAAQLEEIFSWTEWPQLNAGRYSSGGLIIGLPDFGTFYPSVPTLDNVTIRTLQLVTYIQTYKLKLNVIGLDGYTDNPIIDPGNIGMLAKVGLVCFGPSINEHLNALGEHFFADYGLSFHNEVGVVANPQIALETEDGYVLSALNRPRPISEILVIDGPPSNLHPRAFRLEPDFRSSR